MKQNPFDPEQFKRDIVEAVQDELHAAAQQTQQPFQPSELRIQDPLLDGISPLQKAMFVEALRSVLQRQEKLLLLYIQSSDLGQEGN